MGIPVCSFNIGHGVNVGPCNEPAHYVLTSASQSQSRHGAFLCNTHANKVETEMTRDKVDPTQHVWRLE
jgi:hypothetical protein